jgi:hypothetical protein
MAITIGSISHRRAHTPTIIVMGMSSSHMSRCRVGMFVLAAIVGACGGSASPPASTGDGQVLTGTERFGWDQPANDRSELASFKYAMYVDGTRTEAVDVTCENTRSAAGFACTCRLPSMTPGQHTLQVAAFVNDAGTVRESSRSAPVRVTMR